MSITFLKWGDYGLIFIIFSISIGQFYWGLHVRRKTLVEIEGIWQDTAKTELNPAQVEEKHEIS